MLCSKYLSGKCSMRNKCTFVHQKPDPNDYYERERKLCRLFYEFGTCRKGWDCPDVHGSLCQKCALYSIYPEDIDGQWHAKTCEMEMESMTRRYSKMSMSQKCAICRCKVVKHRHRFAILESCNHVFCAPCIKRWRSITDQPRQTTRGCPICRTVSHLYVPNDYWIDDKVEKEAFFANYKNSISNIPCRYLRNGYQYCPFGVKCHYSHLQNDVEICRGKPGVIPKALMSIDT
uniref:RING-type E3 ubiquitin transferase n=1 Tax=Panagrellus redivivus TaxID=6233 RepID=A0A7E4ZTS8_PANRE